MLLGAPDVVEVDRAVVLLAAIVVTVAAAQVRVLVAIVLGDETARDAGRVWSPRHLVDRTGTLIVPAFLALASGAAIAWWAPPPVRADRLTPGRRAVLEVTAPVTAAVVALASWLGAAAVGHGVASTDTIARAQTVEPLVVVAVVAALLAGFWLLPIPPLPGGALVGLAMPGERGTRWRRLARGSVTPYGLVVGALLVVTDLGDRVVRALG